MDYTHSETKWTTSHVIDEMTRQAVFRLRYDVYVREMGRRSEWADHDSGQLSDPLDENADLLAVYEYGVLVGTVRANLATDETATHYRSLYGIDQCLTADDVNRTAVVTKLIVRADRRHTGAAYQLFAGIYTLRLTRGTRFAFIDSNLPLVPLYLKYGFKEYAQPIDHPEYGEVVPLMLDLHDREHFERVRSPFAALLRQWRETQAAPQMSG